MAEVFQQLYSINIVRYVGVEDFADRLNFMFTVTLLSVCCALTTAMSYVMQPISCFLPNTFGEFHDGKELVGQMEYATNFCWTEGTYAVHPLNFSIDGTARDGGLGAYSDKKIVYYQWVPFLLAFQGVMFYLPRLLWHSISYDRAGTDVGHIVKVASDASREEEETHDKLVIYACRMIEVMLDRRPKGGSAAASSSGLAPTQGALVRARIALSRWTALIMPTRLSGSWLILTYFLIKLAYLTNAIGQLVLMQHFLQLRGSHYSLLGISLLRDIVLGRDWQNSMVFPRVGCCAVFFRSGAGGNWQYSQCTLPVNIINEKIYILLWFWFVFVAAATLISTVAWLYRVVNASLTSRFVKKYLRLADNYAELKARKLITRNFTRQFLRRDGAFVLKMIALNAGDVVCAEIIQHLWQRHLSIEGFHDESSAGADADEADVDADGAAPKRKPEAGILKLSCEGLQSAQGNSSRRRRGSLQLRTKKPRARDVSFYLDDGDSATRNEGGGCNSGKSPPGGQDELTAL